jgi:hypothetical protein
MAITAHTISTSSAAAGSAACMRKRCSAVEATKQPQSKHARAWFKNVGDGETFHANRLGTHAAATAARHATDLMLTLTLVLLLLVELMELVTTCRLLYKQASLWRGIDAA